MSATATTLKALDFCISVADGAVGVPTVIIANTVKGKGVSFMEGKSAWHGKAIDDESFTKSYGGTGRCGQCLSR